MEEMQVAATKNGKRKWTLEQKLRTLYKLMMLGYSKNL